MDNTHHKISALLITFNEENHIEEVLDNLNFADEIIVVDSFSTDKTLDIIKSFSEVKYIQRAFENYTDQKRFALEQASFEWVLFLDADERIPEALQKEILTITKTKKETACAYFFFRTFMFKNKVLRFSGWQTDKNYRLFKKDKVKFAEDRIVHETLIVDGASQTLKNRLVHYSYSSYANYKSKMIKYGQMKAKDEFAKGKRTKWYHIPFHPLYKFMNHYIFRFGFLDGYKGVIICYLNALGVWSKCITLKKITKDYDSL